MHRLHLELACREDAIARAVCDAVAVETLDGPGGASIHVTQRGACVWVDVEAAEPGSLRAAAHGTLRLADMAMRALGPA